VNAKTWGLKFVRDIFDKYFKLFFYEEDVYYVNVSIYDYELTNIKDEWWFKYDSDSYLSGNFGHVSRMSRATKYNSKEEAIKAAGNRLKTRKEHMVKKFVKWSLPVAILADLSLWAFLYSPVATLSVLGTLTTIQSTRWLSGKLAKNVKHTKSNTDRIVKLEGEEDADNKG